ncbi:hypothetical protein BDZ97DRAFT_1589948, partial [Flammula alnicola]
LLNLSSAGMTFLVCSDNQGIVTIVNNGRSCSRNMNMVLKEVYKLLAIFHISLMASYVSSRENVTDALSHG